MDKLDLNLDKLEKLDQFDNKFNQIINKLDKMQSDITALKTDNKDIHKKLDMIVDTMADIKDIIKR